MLIYLGTYSLISDSEEERVAKEYIESNQSDLILIVVDATSIERNLNLVYQILSFTTNVIICVNLLDEATKKGISIDLNKLSNLLGVPVVGTIARKKKTLNNLLNTIYTSCTTENRYDDSNIEFLRNVNNMNDEEKLNIILNKAKEVTKKVCTYSKNNYNERTHKIDKVLTSKVFGIPIMLAFLGLIFWITIVGANYPSQLLSTFFNFIQDKLYMLFDICNSPAWFTSLFIDGIYRTLAWVISVMLPPMAIFFPLFTLLEDLGYLPRIAFNLDRCFKKCYASRKTSSYNVYGIWM